MQDIIESAKTIEILDEWVIAGLVEISGDDCAVHHILRALAQRIRIVAGSVAASMPKTSAHVCIEDQTAMQVMMPPAYFEGGQS